MLGQGEKKIKCREITHRRVFATSERNLLDFVDSVERPRILAFEEMNIAHWFFFLLKDRVDQISVAHPAHLSRQRGPKTDFIDSLRLLLKNKGNRTKNIPLTIS
jgi:hypothetical protein